MEGFGYIFEEFTEKSYGRNIAPLFVVQFNEQFFVDGIK
jgi:hypothetical protein